MIDLIFFLSAITYHMKEEVFRTWWNIARWFVLIIILVTLLQNTAHQQSGFGGVAQGSFDFLILIILYTLFILISSIKIIQAYRMTK